jgi:hypothetical protein
MTYRTAVVNLTPPLAEEWLTQNIAHNRPTSQRAIDEYARDMKEGRWRQTFQPIIFDTEGRLVDGQQRCLAVIKADTTVPMFVVRGANPDSYELLDRGKKRSLSNVLHSRGEVNTSSLGTMLGTYLRHERGLRLGSHRGAEFRATLGELLEVLERQPALRDAARYVGQFGGMIYRSALGYTRWCAVHEDRLAAMAFFDRVRTGVGLLDKTDPGYHLRRRILAEQARRPVDRLNPDGAFPLIIKAWNKAVAGESMRTLAWSGYGARKAPYPHLYLPAAGVEWPLA